MFASDDERWRAVTQRDARADGVFVYAVRTTRIYCRPNCKARLARRANVCFYTGWAAAEAGGFRACKRCKPRTQGQMPEDESVARIRQLVASDLAGSRPGRITTESPSLLASRVCVSRWHFHRKFKQVVGQTPQEYLNQRERDREAMAAAPTAVPLPEVAPLTQAQGTVGGRFAFAWGEDAPAEDAPAEDALAKDAQGDALWPDLARLLAETEHGAITTAGQPSLVSDGLFTADSADYTIHEDELDRLFLDSAFWAAVGETRDGWQAGSLGESEPVVSAAADGLIAGSCGEFHESLWPYNPRADKNALLRDVA
ncbi:hypothetical protein SEPCBS119000_000549 [Sporothrix epigloea]|uniref:HTH araC/xylS-type domain-containing protein n=1 Tax=Sporothrix epigloea TaxID=1892477 RepID=A0ABP0D5Q6_9PEZI